MTRTGKSKRIAVGTLALSLAVTFAAGYWLNRARAAGIPTMAPLTYSGTLTAGDGIPLIGQRTIQVALHTQASGGSAACSSAAAAVTLVAGTFQVSLGDACTAIVHANRDPGSTCWSMARRSAAPSWARSLRRRGRHRGDRHHRGDRCQRNDRADRRGRVGRPGARRSRR